MKILTVFIAILLTFVNLALCEEIESLSRSFKTPENLIRWMSTNLVHQWTFPDKPKTSEEVLRSRSGDCDDFATLASDMLRFIGITSAVVVIRFRGLAAGHAICAWEREGGGYSFISNKELTHTQCSTLPDLLKRFYPDFKSYRIL